MAASLLRKSCPGAKSVCRFAYSRQSYKQFINKYCPPCILQHSVRKFSDVLGDKTVRIGYASGFWGDTACAAPQLVHNGGIDFLVFDYLSEITMSLLTAARHKKPDLGYAPDFVLAAVGPLLNEIKKRGIRVVSNAGGVNPHACAAALQEAAKKAGVDIKVAVVTGDDLMHKKDEIIKSGTKDIDCGITAPKTLVSMNAYLGAGPITKALDMGTDIVVTGRCVDSAVVLGPLMHTFGWNQSDYTRLASASLAGHIAECGAQATGGVFTDWHLVQDWDNIGFPIIECGEEGAFVVTKPPNTGGLVSKETVAEQLVYELGDPARYMLPDVICDFRNVTLQNVEGDPNGAVLVTGAKGLPPTTQFKVSGTYADGFRATSVSPITGPNAAEKGRKTAESILKRTRTIFKQLELKDYTQTNVQILGSEQSYGPHARDVNPREAVIWIAAQHSQKKAMEIFAREVAPAGTGMAPGLTGIVGGRPRVSPVLKLFSFLYPKDQVQATVHIDGKEETITASSPESSEDSAASSEETVTQDETLPVGDHTFSLMDLAYTRSGDKGNNATIGVIARHPSYVPYIRRHLTADAVHSYFKHVIDPETVDPVTRYELPGIDGFSFLLRNSLGGGGVASLLSDPQGKGYGQMLLDIQITNVPDLVSMTK
ncbi:uncharacterized protein LOC117293880 [Asterias rubens]|uniref:uncharacterized protein LOC117293880 n=1 Tax=Asterias rubens TaxID=7604 RepID=UPI001454FE77|nr:uncharacterized protein LOC117293880 [Asterias rubens]